MEILSTPFFKIGLGLLIFLIICYLLLLLYLYLNQTKMLYYPTKELVGTPTDIGLNYQTHQIKTEDGVTLSAWFIPAKNSRGTVLFCHGNGGNISHRLETIRIFHHLNLSTLIFDYRGYGESEGKPSELGTYQDVEAAYFYLIKELKVDPSNLIIFGRSLGGSIASYIAHKEEAKIFIVESSFTSIPDMGQELYPYIPVRLLSKYQYKNSDNIQKVTIPVLIIHSPDDEIVPYNHGVHLFKYANPPKEFLEITGGHNEGFLESGQKYVDGLNGFISKYID